MADPNEPSLSGTFDTENAGDLALSGDHAYIVDWINGLKIVNINNPASPTLIGTYETTGFPKGLTVSGNYAYILDSNDLYKPYSNSLRVLDVMDPSDILSRINSGASIITGSHGFPPCSSLLSVCHLDIEEHVLYCCYRPIPLMQLGSVSRQYCMQH